MIDAHRHRPGGQIQSFALLRGGAHAEIITEIRTDTGHGATSGHGVHPMDGIGDESVGVEQNTRNAEEQRKQDRVEQTLTVMERKPTQDGASIDDTHGIGGEGESLHHVSMRDEARPVFLFVHGPQWQRQSFRGHGNGRRNARLVGLDAIRRNPGDGNIVTVEPPLTIDGGKLRGRGEYATSAETPKQSGEFRHAICCVRWWKWNRDHPRFEASEKRGDRGKPLRIEQDNLASRLDGDSNKKVGNIASASDESGISQIITTVFVRGQILEGDSLRLNLGPFSEQCDKISRRKGRAESRKHAGREHVSPFGIRTIVHGIRTAREPSILKDVEKWKTGRKKWRKWKYFLKNHPGEGKPPTRLPGNDGYSIGDLVAGMGNDEVVLREPLDYFRFKSVILSYTDLT